MQEKKYKRSDSHRNRKRRIATFTLIIVLFSIIGYAAYTYITIVWVVITPPPLVELLSPADDYESNVDTVTFNWTGSGGYNPLWYVFYADSNPTFTSPNLITIDTNTTTNITYGPFEDGNWYWRVEATDNISINVSETRHFAINTVPANNFPNLTNPSVYPSTGNTSTNFTYNITFTDADGDMPSYIRVYIDGNLFNMTETDALDVNTTNGKNYSYSTHLNTSTHNYIFTCSDGNATNVTELFSGPTVLSTPPQQSGVVPANNSVGINPSSVLYVNCSDYDGNTMSASWWSNSSGAWVQFGVNLSFGNNTNISQSNSNFSGYSTTYYWSLNLTDGHSWNNITYTFTTTPFWINACPTSSNAIPANNSVEVNINVGSWKINISDVDGNNTNGTIECSNGQSTSWSNQSDGQKTLPLAALTYGTTYTVWVNYSDEFCSVNETYTFTTMVEMEIQLVSPTDGATGECPCCITLGVTIENTEGLPMNLTFYSNLSGSWDYFYLGTENVTLTGLLNGTYYINVPFFSIYNHTYYWNVSMNNGVSTINSPVYSFRTALNPDNCSVGGGSSGNNNTSIVGIVGIIGILGFIFEIRRRKKRR